MKWRYLPDHYFCLSVSFAATTGAALEREDYRNAEKLQYPGKKSQSERYVAQIFHAAFLAPDIVDAILDGQQPVGLTMEKLRKRPAVDWQEQRTRLGFT